MIPLFQMKHKSAQPQEGGGSLRPEHLCVNAAPSRNFSAFQLVHCPPSFLWGEWITAYIGVRIPDSVSIPEKLTTGWSMTRYNSSN